MQHSHPHFSSGRFRQGFVTFLLIALVLLLVCIAGIALYMGTLDARVRERFEGRRWELPAQIYARPLELYKGAPVRQKDLEDELKLLQYTPAAGAPTPGTYEASPGRILLHSRRFDFGNLVEPDQIIALRFAPTEVEDISFSDSRPATEFLLEPLLIGGIYPRHNEDRVLIKLDDTPRALVDALVATEDRQFFTHHGISVRGLSRAVVSNLRGGPRQGGSTLTQQLVKNFYLSSERSIKRKANEALMAILLESHYTKQDILETYLNEVNLGQNGNLSVNGFGLASRFYFGKPLNELTTAQQAMLVGMVKGPTLYNPWRSPEAALERRNVVLHNMLVTGAISPATYKKAVRQPLGVLTKPGASQTMFPDFMDLVRRQLKEQYPIDELSGEGFKVFTTLDPVVQTRSQAAFGQAVSDLVKRNPKKLGGLQGAALLADPHNGYIVAAMGGTGNFTGFNRTVDAHRPIGSLVKPAVYLTALQTQQYNLASTLQDTPITLNTNTGHEWTPRNYDQQVHGNVGFIDALAHSYNLATVNLGNSIGLDNVINTLKTLGVKSDIPNFPSVFLGAINLNPYSVLGMYQMYANNGQGIPLTTIERVIDSGGHTIAPAAMPETSRLDPGATYLLNTALQQVVKRGTAASINGIWPEYNLAGKTGTTNDARDAWFAGYSGNYAGVVWLGHDDNRPTGLSGSSGALPVWTSIFRQLSLKPLNPVMPETVQKVRIDPENGLAASEDCVKGVDIPMFISSAPMEASPCALPPELHIDSENPEEDPANMDPDTERTDKEPVGIISNAE